MDPLQTAAETIAAPLREGRIGTPVSVRIVAHLTADADELQPLRDRAVGLACQWLNSKLQRQWSLGSSAMGHLSEQLTFENGQTALASVGLQLSRPQFLHIVLVGNRGILTWELDTGPSLGNPMPTAAHFAEPIGRPAAPIGPLYGVLLVTGAHSHQEMYAPMFAADYRCRLIGVTDEADLPARRRELNERLAQSLGVPFFPDLRAAIARDDVHIVSICAAPERRAKIIVQCADAGKHLYLDKPLCATMAEAREIMAAVRKARVYHQMFSLVHGSFAERVRHALNSGMVGTLLAVHCDAYFAKGPAGTARLGFPRRESSSPTAFEAVVGKRELHNVGVYSLVLMTWLLGRRVERVFASTANYFFAEHQQLDMEDFAQVTLEFEGGIVGTVSTGRTGWSSHLSGGLNRVYLVGTTRACCIDAHRPRVEVWADETAWAMPRRHPEDPMGFWTSTQQEAGVVPKRSWITPAEVSNDVNYFVNCLHRGWLSDMGADDGASAMEMILAAYRSAASGEAVTLPLDTPS